MQLEDQDQETVNFYAGQGLLVGVLGRLPVVLLHSAADFSRVFLIGDSSGGNLVHEVAARAGRAEEMEEGFWAPLRIAGGIPLHHGFVPATRSKSELDLPDTEFLTLEMLAKFLALALPEGATKDHPYTCPMGEAAPPMEKLRLPPLLVAVAEEDLIRDTNMEYDEALKKARKKVEVHMSAGVGHSFHLNKFAVDLDPTTAKRTDIDDHLGTWAHPWGLVTCVSYVKIIRSLCKRV